MKSENETANKLKAHAELQYIYVKVKHNISQIYSDSHIVVSSKCAWKECQF